MIGENKEYYWDYSKASDILNIHRKDIKVVGSAELGDFSVDFGGRGQVVGLEIMYASEFFENVKISREQLIQLKAVELIIPKKRNSQVAYFYVKLVFPLTEQIIPIPAPILAKAN